MTVATRLYEKHDKAALIQMGLSVSEDPTNLAPPGGLYRLSQKARKQIANIDQAIAWHIADERKARGNPVPTAGYSGRQTNHR